MALTEIDSTGETTLDAFDQFYLRAYAAGEGAEADLVLNSLNRALEDTIEPGVATAAGAERIKAFRDIAARSLEQFLG